MSELQRIVDALSANPVLGATNPELLSKAASHCRYIPFRVGRRFIKEGDSAEFVYALVSGGVRVFHRGPDDQEIVVKLFGAPAFFGESDVLLGLSWVQSVETVMASDIVEMPGSVFATLVRRDHALANALIEDLAKRLLIASEQARAMAFSPAESLIAGHLLDYVDLFGIEGDEPGILIDIKLSQEAIGKALSISRKTVQRTLQVWMEQGWVEKRKARLAILDKARLKELAPHAYFSLAYRLDPIGRGGLTGSE